MKKILLILIILLSNINAGENITANNNERYSRLCANQLMKF
jgi:hypothetical protein